MLCAGVIGDTEVEQLHLDLFAQAADDGDIEIGALFSTVWAQSAGTPLFCRFNCFCVVGSFPSVRYTELLWLGPHHL